MVKLGLEAMSIVEREHPRKQEKNLSKEFKGIWKWRHNKRTRKVH